MHCSFYACKSHDVWEHTCKALFIWGRVHCCQHGDGLVHRLPVGDWFQVKFNLCLHVTAYAVRVKRWPGQVLLASSACHQRDSLRPAALPVDQSSSPKLLHNQYKVYTSQSAVMGSQPTFNEFGVCTAQLWSAAADGACCLVAYCVVVVPRKLAVGSLGGAWQASVLELTLAAVRPAASRDECGFDNRDACMLMYVPSVCTPCALDGSESPPDAHFYAASSRLPCLYAVCATT
jgi:hypothetical protein